MTYDFATLPNRAGSGSAKWNIMQEQHPGLDSSIVPLSVADMELENPPEIKRALHDFIDSAVLGYTEPTDAFMEACCNWQQRRHGWKPEPEWLVVSPGVVPAFFNAVKVFTEPGDGVIIQTPVYHPFRFAAERNGRTVVQNPLKKSVANGIISYQIDFEDLEAKAADPKNKILVFCNPHNPVGRVWSADDLRRVLDICAANDVMLVSDEIHADITVFGHRHNPIMSVATAADLRYIIVCCSPSKTFNIAGAQVSAIFIPDATTREAFNKGFGAAALGHELNAFAYPAATAAYNECEPWLDEFIRLVEKNFNVLRDLLSQSLPEIIVTPLEGTYLAWVDFSAWNLSDEALERFMTTKAHLFLDEGCMFGKQGSGFERINLACPTVVIEEAIGRLVNAAKDCKTGSFAGH